MKLCTAVQEGCGYKDTLRAHRYYAPLVKYFTVCITYQPTVLLTCGTFKNEVYTSKYKASKRTRQMMSTKPTEKCVKGAGPYSDEMHNVIEKYIKKT